LLTRLRRNLRVCVSTLRITSPNLVMISLQLAHITARRAANACQRWRNMGDFLSRAPAQVQSLYHLCVSLKSRNTFDPTQIGRPPLFSFASLFESAGLFTNCPSIDAVPCPMPLYFLFRPQQTGDETEAVAGRV